MISRKNIRSGSPWEDKVGYSRAVKIDNRIEVSGTTAMENDQVQGRNDPYTQTVFIIEKIKKLLEELDSGLGDVIRTRMYVTDINHWGEIGKAHNLYFKEIRPAATMVEVNKLIDPELLVEIEVTAITGHSD